MTMKKFALAAFSMAFAVAPAFAASVVNSDNETRTLIVTEGADKSELAVAPGETVEFCGGGCFVTLPNGDREALTGTETIEIKGGAATIR